MSCWMMITCLSREWVSFEISSVGSAFWNCVLLLSRTELWIKEKSTAYRDLHPSTDSTQGVPKHSTQKDGHFDQAALQKISALEDELTFLRAQIAAIVSAQTLGSIPSRKPFWFEANQFSFFCCRVPVHSLPCLISIENFSNWSYTH